MAIENRQSVRILSRLLTITGIIQPTIVKNRLSWLTGIVRTCSSLLLICAASTSVATFIYRHRYNFSECGLGLPYLGVGLSVLIAFLVFINMRHELTDFLRRIDQNIYTYSQEDQIQTDYPWLYRESSVRSVYSLVFSYEYLGIIPCIFPLIDHVVLKRTDKSFSFPLEMAWDQEKHFWATYTTQVVLAFGMCWFISIIQLFVLFGVIEFSRQNMRLCEALASIERRSENTVTAKMERNNIGAPNGPRERGQHNLFDSEFKTQLKQCIQHHQKVVEMFQIFKRWFSVLFFTELVADSLTFAIIFYNLFQANTWVVYSGLIGSSYIFITSLFTRCLVGEMFSEMNEKITTVIFYEVRWYEQSLNNKRLLSIFHLQTRRPMDLHAFSIFKASFFTFTSLIKTSYSYLNILKASFSSKN